MTHSGDTSIGQRNVDRFSRAELTAEARHARKETAENDTSDPKLRSPANQIIGGGTADGAEAGDDRIGKGQKESSVGGSDAEDGIHRWHVVRQDRVSGELTTYRYLNDQPRFASPVAGEW